MTLAATGRLQQAYRRVMNAITPGALILLYHRVAETDYDPWSLCVTPQRFKEHLEVVQKHRFPVSLSQLTRLVQDRRPSPHLIVITFDDGYANNLYNAKPLLEHYDIPATVFLTSRYVGNNEEFWWDELEQVLLQPGELPETLSLHINGGVNKRMLVAAVDYSETDYRRGHDLYASNAKPGSRLFFYYSVWHQLRTLADDQRRKALDEIKTWAKVKATVRQTHRPLTWEEVGRLEDGGLLEVGAHTATHPFLGSHSLSVQREEIRQSKADLEEVLGHPVMSFSYPHGDYTAETITLVREAGFNCACSSLSGKVQKSTDLFQLPRLEVRNWDGEKFAKRLSNWFHS